MFGRSKGQGVLKYLFYAVVAIVAFLVTVSISSGFIMDYYWFDAVGYLDVFMVNVKYQLFLLFFGWIVTTVCLFLSWRTIKKSLNDNVPSIGSKMFKVFSVFIGLGVGWWFKDKYLIVLKFLNKATWGVTDPIFNHDISFYVFTLPMIKTILTFVISIAVLVLFITTFSHLFGRYSIPTGREGEELVFEDSPASKIWSIEKLLKSWPVLGSIAVLTVAGALFVWIGRYSYLWGFNPGSSIPTEASYMAVNYRIPYTWVQSVGVIIFGASIIYGLRNIDYFSEKIEVGKISDFRNELAVLGVLFLVFILIPLGVFGAINSFNVQPDEPGIQEEYLNYTIEYTNRAYDLDDVQETSYGIDPENELTFEEAWSSPTVKNARIVDYRPIKQDYQERQRLRPYYEFQDVDVGRYYVDSDNKRLAVISGREVDTGEVSAEGGRWQTDHLIYTHGFGAVLSPANEVKPSGSPIMAVSDIPPISKWKGVDIKEPRVYFGERTNNYALVGANGLDELDYEDEKGDAEYNRFVENYPKCGIKIGSTWKKLVSWFYTGDFKIMVSDYVGEEATLLLHRNVHQRVKKIAPFLRYDSNAHLFADDDGSLTYLLNGIAQASNYPYSYNDADVPGYLSDSVKAFVKANSGKLQFYTTDEAGPVVETFSNIYPELFEEKDMSGDYRNHIIYPTELFDIQMNIYKRYHMDNARSFYQRQDVWDFAKELYHGGTTRVESYNIFYDATKLPNFENNEEEFMLVKPFTPQGKQNLTAWIGIGQDNQNYGKKIELNFPSGEFTGGPEQAESLIDQKDEISEQFSLWGQRGSRVLRGNLLALPVKNDILYIEPVYLEATDLGIPQLVRVIAVYFYEDGSSVAMENNLRNAVKSVLGEKVTPPSDQVPGDNVAPPELVDLVSQYLELQQEYNQLIREGSYAEAGQIRERMEDIADNMSRYVQ